MQYLKNLRNQRGLSQRELAAIAGISYKTLQSLENEAHAPNFATLQKVLQALGYPPETLAQAVAHLLRTRSDSIREISKKIVDGGEDLWKTWLFNFVDAYRRDPHAGLADDAPVPQTSSRVLALLASTVEQLCEETHTRTPWWVSGVRPLSEPWFVAGMKRLGGFSIIESPVAFRKRNIFVFENFLHRA